MSAADTDIRPELPSEEQVFAAVDTLQQTLRHHDAGHIQLTGNDQDGNATLLVVAATGANAVLLQNFLEWVDEERGEVPQPSALIERTLQEAQEAHG